MRDDIDDLLDIWEGTTPHERCRFCGGDTNSIHECCDEAGLDGADYDVEAVAALVEMFGIDA